MSGDKAGISSWVSGGQFRARAQQIDAARELVASTAATLKVTWHGKYQPEIVPVSYTHLTLPTILRV